MFFYLYSAYGCFCVQIAEWVIATKTPEPAKVKIFTIYPLLKSLLICAINLLIVNNCNTKSQFQNSPLWWPLLSFWLEHSWTTHSLTLVLFFPTSLLSFPRLDSTIYQYIYSLAHNLNFHASLFSYLPFQPVRTITIHLAKFNCLRILCLPLRSWMKLKKSHNHVAASLWQYACLNMW